MNEQRFYLFHQQIKTILVLAISFTLSACLSAPNNKPTCSKFNNKTAFCDKPEKPQFVEDFLDAAADNAKSRQKDTAYQNKKDDNEGSDVAVGLVSAFFQMLSRIFGSDAD